MTNSIRIALLFSAAAVMASAASYRLTLPVDATIGGQELKAGDYKVDVNGDTAVMKRGKQMVEAKVTTETLPKKNDSTSVKYSQDGGKYTLQSIQIGGKNLKLVFDSAKTANGGV